MKILLVSMNNLHFTRWSEQLRESGHEIYWFDILDQGYSPAMSWMTQVTGWKKGFLKKKGRSFIKKRFPKFFSFLSSKLDVSVETAFEKALLEIQPDVVHSFALYISCTPILKVMNTYENVKWMYSSWGSDLYYYQNIPEYLNDIQKVLPRVDYLITDCLRDHKIAIKHGFKGDFLGAFPGGGGFELENIQKRIKTVSERKVILIKGNQNRSGRALPVLEAIVTIKDLLTDYQVVVFGTKNQDVFEFQNETNIDIQVLGWLTHDQIINFMSKALIYIGNSNSDGMPNTMLEAICCGAFPIQSNPGGATAEVVTHRLNGLLIEDCEDHMEIREQITFALDNNEVLLDAFKYNQTYAQEHLSRVVVTRKVLKIYDIIYS
ncbi:glycosyltransferase [Nonlabens sp. Asnod3-A02]|uniref:glycosyltransferase n=1 Tax=Nonlabens sp. Asnod3-A02 TaxID=3160579 RepID=UPI00386B6739